MTGNFAIENKDKFRFDLYYVKDMLIFIPDRISSGDYIMTTRRAILASLGAIAATFSLSACGEKQEQPQQQAAAVQPRESTVQVVIFHADWCPFCAVHTPAMKDYADKNRSRLKLTVIDFDANQDLVQINGVQGLPTTLVLKDGVVAARHEGVMDAAQIETMVAAAEARTIENVAATIKPAKPAQAGTQP